MNLWVGTTTKRYSVSICKKLQNVFEDLQQLTKHTQRFVTELTIKMYLKICNNL